MDPAIGVAAPEPCIARMAVLAAPQVSGVKTSSEYVTWPVPLPQSALTVKVKLPAAGVPERVKPLPVTEANDSHAGKLEGVNVQPVPLVVTGWLKFKPAAIAG